MSMPPLGLALNAIDGLADVAAMLRASTDYVRARLWEIRPTSLDDIQDPEFRRLVEAYERHVDPHLFHSRWWEINEKPPERCYREK